MRKSVAATLIALAVSVTPGLLGSRAVGQGMDRLEPGQMTADQIRIVLGARGYGELGPMEREGETVRVAEAKRYGEATGPLRLDAKTGRVLDEAPLSPAQARALLRDRGFAEVSETGREGDAILATGMRAGTRVDLRVDARSGAVTQR